MNHMEEIAKILGVELNEDFMCDNGCYPCRVTEKGFLCHGVAASDILMMLLNGDLTVSAKSWRPNEGDIFWYVGVNGNPLFDMWKEYGNHINFYKIGNCYKTEVEAKENRDKWVAFYASDEILEV